MYLNSQWFFVVYTTLQTGTNTKQQYKQQQWRERWWWQQQTENGSATKIYRAEKVYEQTLATQYAHSFSLEILQNGMEMVEIRKLCMRVCTGIFCALFLLLILCSMERGERKKNNRKKHIAKRLQPLFCHILVSCFQFIFLLIPPRCFYIRISFFSLFYYIVWRFHVFGIRCVRLHI